jgi:cytochrome c oxidase subunit 3
MTRTMDIDVAHLPTQLKRADTAIWWGQLLMMTIEGVLFAVLIASYCYVRVNFAVWPPPGIENPDLVLPTIGFVVLLVSCLPMLWSDKALNEKNRNKVLLGLIINAAMALVFLGIRWREFVAFDFKWNTNIYGSLIWSILGLHTMHTIADTIETLVFIGIVLTRKVGEKQQEGLEVDGFYWGFVVVTWVPLFFIIYVYPYLVKPI